MAVELLSEKPAASPRIPQLNTAPTVLEIHEPFFVEAATTEAKGHENISQYKVYSNASFTVLWSEPPSK